MVRTEPLFHEEQKFQQVRLRVILALPPAFLLFLTIWHVALGHTAGKQTLSNGGLISLTVFLWLLYFWLIRVRLITEVWPAELSVQLRGLWRKRRIPLSEIKAAKVVRFDAIRDFGGYGIRSGRHGTAYIAGGHRGVRLDLAGKRALIIGSERPDELASAIRKPFPANGMR